MSEVHEVAARGFGAEATAYDRARPSYPPDAIAWLTDNLGIGPGRQVIDLAAGTGKLTAPLAHTGAELVAVEPVRSMRDRLHERLPNVPVLAGVAEALPLGIPYRVDVMYAKRLGQYHQVGRLARHGTSAPRDGVRWSWLKSRFVHVSQRLRN
jgi:hypothetical protein